MGKLWSEQQRQNTRDDRHAEQEYNRRARNRRRENWRKEPVRTAIRALFK